MVSGVLASLSLPIIVRDRRMGKWLIRMLAISEGHGEAAMVLLRAGAESDKKDRDGYLPIDLAPDKSVSLESSAIIAKQSIERVGTGKAVRLASCRARRD